MRKVTKAELAFYGELLTEDSKVFERFERNVFITPKGEVGFEVLRYEQGDYTLQTYPWKEYIDFIHGAL